MFVSPAPRRRARLIHILLDSEVRAASVSAFNDRQTSSPSRTPRAITIEACVSPRSSRHRGPSPTAPPARLEKISHLADLLTRVPPDAIAIVIGFLSGEPRQGTDEDRRRTAVEDARRGAGRRPRLLDVFEVDAAFDADRGARRAPDRPRARAAAARPLRSRATARRAGLSSASCSASCARARSKGS